MAALHRSAALVFACAACGHPSRAPEKRSYLPPYHSELPMPRQEIGDTPELTELNPLAPSVTACEWLSSLSSRSEPQDNFRMADRLFAIAIPPLVRTPDKASAACDKIYRKNGQVSLETWDLCRKYSIRPNNGASRAKMFGRIDLAMSPLYQYALPKRIPTTDEFLKLAYESLRKRGDGSAAVGALVPDDRWRSVLFPITMPLHMLDFVFPTGFLQRSTLYLGLRTGALDAAETRNKQIGNVYNQVFPGIFDASDGMFRLENAFPEILLRNGSPALPPESLAQRTDGPVHQEITRQWNEVLDLYTRAVALFREGGWSGFRTDMSSGLTAAIRGLSTQDPVQQACGSILFQRATAQLLTMMGFERPVLETNPAKRQSRLPSIANLLLKKDDTRLLVCDSPGLFGRGELAFALSRNDLENYEPLQQGYLELAATPQAPPLCRPEQAVPTEEGEPNPPPPRWHRAPKTASASDWIEMTSGVGHLLMALSPSSSWWSHTVWRHSPMTKFSDQLAALGQSRAIVPVDIHALALALLSIGSTNLIDRHLTYLDQNFHEVSSDSAKVLGLRLSESQRKVGDGGVILTRARSAVLAADFAFKFPSYLDGLRAWATAPHSETEIKDLYGSQSNLHRLTATGRGSLRDQLDQLQFGISMLLASLARRQSNGKITCAASLVTDLNQGTETPNGFCSPQEHALWKSMLARAAQKFHSPQLAELAAD